LNELAAPRAAAQGAAEGIGEPFSGRLFATPGGEVEIRPCQGHAELDACVRLQQETWGYGDLETAPRKFFLLAGELGGHVIGAFRGGELVGFAMAMAALDTGTNGTPEAYLHSHMLAVALAFRNAGLGTQLKLAQREEALGRGLRRMTWTFDPLAAKNAHLNLHRLGAVARRYRPNFYGVSSSRLQGGLPTDRLVAEWWLDSPWVCERLGESGPGASVPEPAATIRLPEELAEWRAEGTAAAEEQLRILQARLAREFADAFGAGLVAAGFSQDTYLLLRPEQVSGSLHFVRDVTNTHR
jgi:predicted GNAT superfamily acetyltransferase